METNDFCLKCTKQCNLTCFCFNKTNEEVEAELKKEKENKDV